MSSRMSVPAPSPVVFGHPAGLYTLFFAEMWERFSFYGMRALLVLYMMKDFLSYSDQDAYRVYGAYTALVYMTPFFGGMLADRVLGARRAVVLGAILMSAGHLLMTQRNALAFFTALALLIAGNGFFKPNISTIVGALYPPNSVRRDAGFTIFYLGINLGAGLAPLLCGYIGETYGWEYGFGLATIGMLAGLVVFVNWTPPAGVGEPPGSPSNPDVVTHTAPDNQAYRSQLSILIIFSGAVAAAVGLLLFHATYPGWLLVNGIMALFLIFAALVSCYAQTKTVRAAPRGWKLVKGELAVYAGTLVAIPILMLLVSGLAPFTSNNKSVSLVSEDLLATLGKEKKVRDTLLSWRRLAANESPRLAQIMTSTIDMWHSKEFLAEQHLQQMQQAAEQVRDGRFQEARKLLGELASQFHYPLKAVLYVVVEETSKPAGLVLFISGVLALGYLVIVTGRLPTVARQRMYVVLILTFFSMLFWAFFEQAGSSLNNFTDRNIDRVFEKRRIGPDDVGKTLMIVPTQEQLGYRNGDEVFTLDKLNQLRSKVSSDSTSGNVDEQIPWKVVEDNIGMGIAARRQEIPASTFQSVNPICILLFGLLFSALWELLRRMRAEPSTPMKFALGLLQLGLGFLVIWYGAQQHDERGMVAVRWLLLGYLLHTTGELCLSPVGLSMVTRLAPDILVSTVMGAWFLATAFSQFLAAIIAQFTNVTEGMEGEVPVPIDTVEIYGGVFNRVGWAAIGSAIICMLLVPLLKKWMHEPPASGAVSDT